MATTTRPDQIVKQQDEQAGQQARQVVQDQLEQLARQGARDMLTAALNDEVDAYLGRDRYQRQGTFRGYRNGSAPRRLTLGSGTVALRAPRVRDLPEGQPPFESNLLRKYQRRSDALDQTFLQLFVEGLATRDFEPALRLLVGADAPLSPSTISRLTQQFRTVYQAFDRQRLDTQRFVYLWADGIYLKAGLGSEKACLMVLIGADTEGRKHLIALREGYRESAQSWGALLADCRQRGLNQPACWIGDGALGLWAGIDEHSPDSNQQRCTNHKTMNVVDKLPLRERPETVQRMRGIWGADSEPAARKLAASLIQDFRKAGYDRAADCLGQDLDRCLTFFSFPEAHWAHLRTSNVIESPFAGVRLRTNAAKRFKRTKSGVYLVHQVLLRQQQSWRRLKSAQLCRQVPLPANNPARTTDSAA